MVKVGITGGIGSGKTVVCKLFALSGAPVYDADEAAKRLMHENESLQMQLIKTFGNIYDENGVLQRSILAEKVFGDATKLKLLNNLVHPVVIADFMMWEQQQTFPYLIKESAILFESKTDEGLDQIIVVSAPEQLRIRRIMERDNRTSAQIKEIMNSQLPEERKAALADYEIINDEIQPLLPQVWALHKIFMNGN